MVTKTPMNAIPKMTRPIGTLPPPLPAGVKVGMTSGGGGVKVGRRVGVVGMENAAARVGSIVGVVRGVAVGGGSMIGKKPGERATNGAYTQPMPPGTPG